jgi:hypothetical protein
LFIADRGQPAHSQSERRHRDYHHGSRHRCDGLQRG